ncbi:MAG TPA: biotin/lipoyl-containing protein [Acidobacteriaceae bacterium]|jgi:biotin carboxyl carrier protein|nr:biotin/lipoyl-containing protein [Acidobacteriaceae bacterium]
MTLNLEIDGRACQVEVDPADSPGQWRIRVDGQPVEADAHLLRPGVLSLLIDGQSFRIVLDADPNAPALHIGAQRIPYRIDDPRSLRSRRRHVRTDGPVTLKASMPGRVVRLLVKKGDVVAIHQSVLVLEAMKMQNEIKSPKDGQVRDLRVSAGDTVAVGDILAIIE